MAVPVVRVARHGPHAVSWFGFSPAGWERAKTRFASAAAVRAGPQGVQGDAPPGKKRRSVARPRDQLAFSLLSITLISLKECGLTGSPSVCSCTHFRVYAMVP